MKVTIITVVFNAEKYIEDCIKSVLDQDYENIEYLIIDGKSTDNTCSIIKSYEGKIHKFISEPDGGMYDALNKGISLANGEVMGILNADDVLASKTIISEIVNAFKESKAEAVYGNLNYVSQDQKKIIRKWISKPFEKSHLKWGWMPAHPTLYLKKSLFVQHGNYAMSYGTAADYDLMLRFFSLKDFKSYYLDKLIVNMRVGGMSNSSFQQRVDAFINDYKAAKINLLPFPILTILLKKINKLNQFFR